MFDYVTATKRQVLLHSLGLKDLTLGELAKRVGKSQLLAGRDKGAVGKLVQTYFGMPFEESEERPDFPTASMELKVIPVWRRRGPLFRSKEATSISMIDYKKLPTEKWESASVRKKLDSILFVFYEHSLTRRKQGWRVLGTVDWSPGVDALPILKADWLRVRKLVSERRAHELSEKLSLYLSARRKSSGGKKESLRAQLAGGPGAKRRAWALKAAFTSGIVTKALTPKDKLGHLPGIGRHADLQKTVTTAIQRLGRFEGFSLQAVADELKLSIPVGKSGHATVMRRALGQNTGQPAIQELVEKGIEVHVLRCDEAGRPYEHTSLAPFDWMELARETWDKSDLLERLETFLFIPLFGTYRKQPFRELVVGEPFSWRPSKSELKVIEREWKRFRTEVKNGLAYKRLTKASATEIIHVRPHATLKSHRSWAPNGLGGKKQVTICSFWLNRSFLSARLLESVSWPPKPRR